MDDKHKIFSDIVAGCHGSIYRICRAYLYDPSHADDLYQEIMLQVWKSLDNYKGDAKINTWVYRVAVNTAITYNDKHRKARYQPLPEQLQIVTEHTAVAEQEQKLAELHHAISKLTERDRLVISLVLEDMSYKEIAEITGDNTGNIGVKINRIKGRLLKLMENSNGHDDI